MILAVAEEKGSAGVILQSATTMVEELSSLLNSAEEEMLTVGDIVADGAGGTLFRVCWSDDNSWKLDVDLAPSVLIADSR